MRSVGMIRQTLSDFSRARLKDKALSDQSGSTDKHPVGSRRITKAIVGLGDVLYYVYLPLAPQDLRHATCGDSKSPPTLRHGYAYFFHKSPRQFRSHR